MKKKLKNLYSLIVCFAIIATSITALPASSLAADAVSFEDKIIFENDVFSSSEYSLMAENNEEIPESVSVTLRFDESFSCDHENINSDEELTAHRNELKDHYKALNEKIIAQLDLEDYSNFSYSWYGPFIEYTYVTYDKFIVNDYGTLEDKNSAAIECVYIRSNLKYEEEANIGEVYDPEDEICQYSFLKALKDTGILSNSATSLEALDSLQYRGTGINIGILEQGYPNSFINLPYINDSNINEYVYALDPSIHAFNTSSIIGGTKGIASESRLYFANVNASTEWDWANSLYDCCNWLIDKNVNIINMSMYMPGTYGNYDSWTAYADYIVKATKISWIKSAGNFRNNQGEVTHNYISTPGAGLNIITVSSNDFDLTISNFSSYLLKEPWESNILKPTLTAPGGNLEDIPNISERISGTSYAAPFVTGIVALLMQQFQDLKYYPEKVLALLTSTCSPASGQNSVVDEDAGFGIVNYQKAQQAYANCSYYNIIGPCSTNTFITMRNIEIPAHSEILITSNVIYNSGYFSPETAWNSNINYTKVRIEILDNADNIVAQSVTKGNICYLTLNNTSSSTKQYTLYIYTIDAKTDNQLEEGAICYYYR